MQNRTLNKCNLASFFILIFSLFHSNFLFPNNSVGLTTSETDLLELFNNKLVIDSNGDNIADDIAVNFLFSSKNDPIDIEAAATIATRLGFETMAMDPNLCVTTWGEAKKKRIPWLIIFASSKDQGAGICGIEVRKNRGIKVIKIFGETALSRKYAAVNFFSRYPYIWDIQGREIGELWPQVKQHISSLLPSSLKETARISLFSIQYKFKEEPEKEITNRAKEKSGMSGTIRRDQQVFQAHLQITLPSNSKEIAEIFTGISDSHSRGIQTKILNYNGINQVVLHVKGENSQNEKVIIPRFDYAQRFLNPVQDPTFFKKKKNIKDNQSDIAEFYTFKGIYKDTDSDGYSDQLVSKIIYKGSLPHNLINLAARIGLEDCSVTLPFIITADLVDNEKLKQLERPILIGSTNRFIDYLEKIGKARRIPLKPDEGLLEFSPGFNKGGAYIIRGSTYLGENSVIQYMAQTLPYISKPNPGAPVWKDLNRDIGHFFARKSNSGKTCWGILQIDQHKKSYSASDLKKGHIQLISLRHVNNLESFLSDRVFHNISLKNQIIKKVLTVKTGGRLEATEGFRDDYVPQWEVIKFRNLFTSKILKELKSIKGKLAPPLDSKNSPSLFIDLRLSEPEEILQEQANWIRELMKKNGFYSSQFKVRSLCAYKQGFHWIKDDIIAKTKVLDPGSFEIRFSPFHMNLEEKGKYRPEPVRWLQELYPIDEVIARELNIPLKEVHFIKDANLKKSTYKITIFNKNKRKVFTETFTPFTEEMFFQEHFKNWGKVMVSTGGIRVSFKGKEILKEKIETDPLCLWRHFQNIILPRITKEIEKQAQGSLKMEDQPFFHKLECKVWMSEPDYRLGLDEEIVSSLESFHEDLYLNTLDYFNGLVKKDPDMGLKDSLMSQRWTAPGNIIPIIYPSRTGRPPRLETVVNYLESLSPNVDMKFYYQEIKEPVKIFQKIAPMKKLAPPRLTGLIINKEKIAREAIYTQKFETEEELSTAVDMLRILGDLKKQNIFKQLFSYSGLKTLRFILCTSDLQSEFILRLNQENAETNKVISLSTMDDKELRKAIGKVMNPEETLNLAQRLGTLPEINYYIGGYSFQQRPVPVLEVGLKPKGKLVSRKKLTTHKPTIFVLGRQHANEISSTNYGFNIAWLLAKDVTYKKYLKELNIIIEPMENPDGSALAVELQKLTPHHMLHAGRYSALGTDIGYHTDNPDTLITEARVRKEIYDKWLPDIFLNNHGYPSHEWVQQFSNYSPYQFRAYWIPRGWYYFHRGLNRIGTHFHQKAGKRIVEIISSNMKKDVELYETNLRIYERYRRWAERWQPHIHYLELYDGTNIYKIRRGSRASRLSKRRRMTVLEAIPEAMDETAQDDWLALAIRQGTTFIKSFMDLAVESKKTIERIEEEYDNAVHLQMVRHRPLRINKTE
jgi:hypothetical protein